MTKAAEVYDLAGDLLEAAEELRRAAEVMANSRPTPAGYATWRSENAPLAARAADTAVAIAALIPEE